MRFDREPWRKLYRSESADDRLLPVMTRGLRDYLLRHAGDDGTLIAKTDTPAEDMARVLGAHPDEFTVTVGGIERLIASGYLKHRKGRLWIAKFQEAQQTRSANAARQKRFRERHGNARVTQRERNAGVTSNVTSNAPVTVEEKRREEKRSPPTPSEPTRPKPADPMAATWGEIRPDVLRVHARYREAFGLANHKLRNAADVNAITIADAIDAHGEAACMLVLKYARADGMVSGKQDDKGLKHEKITYVLGNPDTFARILRNAEQSEGRDANRRPASELLRKALAL